MKLLSEEFLSKYRGVTPANAGVLFYPVYLRTYSRWLEDHKRRERWDETVERVVEYSLSLYQGPASVVELQAEAENLYDHIFNLKLLPAGRTLWVGGTKAAEKFGEGNFNCSFTVIDSIESFADLFHLLLCGCGVGFRVLKEDVSSLPYFRKVTLINQEYKPVPAIERIEETELHDWCFNEPEHMIEVGDSREGWVEALKIYMNICADKEFHDDGLETVVIINYDNIRPKGERIKSFGGIAPGPEGLMEMFRSITEIIAHSSGNLTPVECMDICNLIGKNVIVGGTRRSSQVALGSPTDKQFLDAKKDLWKNKTHLHRAMSNNSIVFESFPEQHQIKDVFAGIRNNGEPGFFNLRAARRRRPTMEGSNPCMEVLMDNRGFCNLCTINLMSFVDRGYFNIHGALQAISLATRVGSRMTNIDISLPKWDKVQKRDRLLGVSMTGIMDAFDALGWEHDSEEAREVLTLLRKEANDEASRYAHEMRIPRPLLVTTLKPEGTLSQLPTVSSGLHRSYAPYFIRRVRVSDMDPVCKALINIGVPYEPDASKKERMVFSFPLRTSTKISANEEPAHRQFNRYLTMMEHYVDHNASCTLTIGEDEWEEMEKLVYENFDSVVACAFLPKYTDAYPQMPYEEITKEVYEEMMKTFPDLTHLPELVNMYERDEFEEDELEAECAGGACPIK